MRTMVCRAVLLATAVALALVVPQVPPASAETFAGNGGLLCHLDLPDAATENAAGNTNGILYVGNDDANDCIQDDVDDAIGSFHGACIEGSTLTFAANNAEITWTM